MQEKINVQTFSQLAKIFETKTWNKKDQESSSFFNRVSRTLQGLNNEEQQTFLRLLDMMEYYTISDYERLLIEVLKKMQNEIDTKKLCFSPIISNRAIPDIKSSMLVTYLLKSNTIQFDPTLSKLKMTLQLDLEDNQITNLNRRSTFLILVDDFIGTGSSAIETAEYFINKGVLKDKIIILSLVTLNKGIECITEQGFKFVYAVKSLSLPEQIESLIDEDRMSFKKNVETISEKIGIETDDYWGYESSSALLSMIRVPNNTIGAFWKGKNKENIPFPRFN